MDDKHIPKPSWESITKANLTFLESEHLDKADKETVKESLLSMARTLDNLIAAVKETHPNLLKH